MINKIDERFKFIVNKANANAFRAMFFFAVFIVSYRSFAGQKINNDLLLVLGVGLAVFLFYYFYNKIKY